MKFYLIVAKGSKLGMPIPITADLFIIGSDKMCQMRKRSLPPKQCALVTRTRKVFVRDMDSGVLTLVNGTAIAPGAEWPLHSGDRISIGTLEFMVQFREHAVSQRDLEEWAMQCLDIQPDTEEDEDFLSDKYKSASSAAQSIFNQLNAMKGEVKGRLRISTDHGVTVVRFHDAMMIDESEIAFIKKELCDNLNKANLRVLLDLKNIRRMSSAAVAMLTDFYRWLRPWGSSLALCRVRDELESAMTILCMESIPVFKDKRSALTSTW
ncbi:MAG: FHA domain-containing protein [Planctomycetes bacterium]|nr:FHA domain-containing protein [Planctomycetota bacterium]